MTITHPIVVDFDCTGTVYYKHGAYYIANFRAFLFGKDVTSELEDRDLRELSDAYLSDYLTNHDYDVPEIETRDIG